MKNFLGMLIVLLVVFLMATPSFAVKDKRIPSSATPPALQQKRGSGSAPADTIHRYEITFVTGDVEGAGTDANVYITLYGDMGTSPEIKATQPNLELFERNSWDVINFYLDKNYGSIHSIRLRHDNTGKKPGWYVTLVRVRNLEQGGEDIFLIDRWLAQDEGDRKIDITVQRSNAKTIVIKPPFSREFKWTKEPGVAYAWARAYRTNGWFNFYADAFVGGSAAEAGQCADFYTDAVNPVAIRAYLMYVGGPVDFGIASFSELQSKIYFNGSENRNDIKAPFSGNTIKGQNKESYCPCGRFPQFRCPI